MLTSTKNAEKILFVLPLFFVATLFFPSIAILNILATSLLVLFALLSTPFKKKIELLKERPWLWGIFAFFIFILISVFLSENRRNALSALDPRLPLLYFPLSIGLISYTKDFRNRVLLGIAILVTIACLICVCYGIYRSVTLHNSAFLYNDSLSEPTGQQSIYISLLVNFSIYIFSSWFFYRTLAPGKKILLLAGILFLFVASYLLASRNLMAVLYLSVSGFIIYYILKNKKYLEGATLIIGIALAMFLAVKFFPKTINRFKELSYTQFNYQSTGPESHYNMEVRPDQWNGANLRMALWTCGWQLFQQHPVIGVGLGDRKQKLMELYQEKNFQFAIRTQRNLHNNYLDILVGMGITGLLLFLIGWIFLPLRHLLRNQDYLGILLVATLAIALITENYFDRSLGGMLFGFFIPFLLSARLEKN